MEVLIIEEHITLVLALKIFERLGSKAQTNFLAVVDVYELKRLY